MSRLLVPEPPLQLLPSLAVRIGLNEAIVLQQLHFWVQRSQDGWVERPMASWERQFPFFSSATIRRTFTKLRADGLVLVKTITGDAGRVNHYAIDYASVPEWDVLRLSRGCAQAEQTVVHTEEKRLKERTPKSPSSKSEPIGLSEWLGRHSMLTETSVPRAGTKRRRDIAATFADWLGKGLALEEFDLASRGIAADKWHSDRGKFDVEYVLRNLEKFADMGRRVARQAADNGGSVYDIDRLTVNR